MGRSGETPLRTLVLLMRENRSFDHYFGRFPGADGLPPDAPVTPAGSDCLPDPPHTQEAFQALDGTDDYPSPAALTYYEAARIPMAWALASRFTLCDRYFASVLGPTVVNRVFSVAASPGGLHDNPHRMDSALLPRPTIVDRLDVAGIGWACYSVQPYSGYNPIAFYPERRADPRVNRTYQEFLDHAAAGTLPAVSWVIPQDPLTEHPPTPPQWGQRLAALTVAAVAAGPQWGRSAVVLNYDESGGFYDHVRPIKVDSSGYGFRVPCTLASPYAKPGHVSHRVYDHASVLALIERTFGDASLTARDAAADPMDDVFDFGHRTMDPIPFPALAPQPDCRQAPDWAADLLDLPLPRPPPRAAAVALGPPTAELAAGAAGLGVAVAAGAAIGLRRRGRRARQ